MDTYSFIVRINSGTAEDYYDLESLLNENGIKTAHLETEENHDAMGLSINTLVIILPLLVPYIVQLRKIWAIYFKYKKSQKQTVELSIEKDDKKIKIKADDFNDDSVKRLMDWFLEESKSTNGTGSDGQKDNKL